MDIITLHTSSSFPFITSHSMTYLAINLKFVYRMTVIVLVFSVFIIALNFYTMVIDIPCDPYCVNKNFLIVQ